MYNFIVKITSFYNITLILGEYLDRYLQSTILHFQFYGNSVLLSWIVQTIIYYF